jgi:hypothetical protein
MLPLPRAASSARADEEGLAVDGRAALRGVALGLAGALVLAALLQLVDRFDLYTRPPDIPETANLVDRMTALFPYRHAIWPVFFLSNALLGIGMLLLVPLGYLLASRLAMADSGRALLLSSFVPAGIMGGVAQALLLGAVKATIDLAYCDCGFKNEEIVSQVWAQMLAENASTMLVYAAALAAAAGVVLAARLFGGRAMPATWGWLSYLTAAMLVLNVLLSFADVGDIADWSTLASIGILVPVWAAWLGLRFEDRDAGATRMVPAG